MIGSITFGESVVEQGFVGWAKLLLYDLAMGLVGAALLAGIYAAIREVACLFFGTPRPKGRHWRWVLATSFVVAQTFLAWLLIELWDENGMEPARSTSFRSNGRSS